MTLSQRYRLEEILGRGGMADVYRGVDLVLERPVAVKLVRATDAADSRRFISETRAMAALNHPGIVQLFDAGTQDGQPYLVMELVEGVTLPEMLHGGPLDAEGARRVGRELAAALAHAHNLGVVHRDVKPANILFDGEGRTRLSDFGIARLADSTRVTEPGMTTGTAAYLAPEQLTGDEIGPPGDVYSLGLVLLEALTGEREFTGTHVEAAMARLQRDPRVPEDLPAPWPDLLVAMTRRDPQQRPAAADVAALLAAEGHPAREQSPATQVLEQRQETGAAGAAAPGKGRSAVAAAALLAIVAVVLLALVDFGGDGGEQPTSEAGNTLPTELDEALQQLEGAVQR